MVKQSFKSTVCQHRQAVVLEGTVSKELNSCPLFPEPGIQLTELPSQLSLKYWCRNRITPDSIQSTVRSSLYIYSIPYISHQLSLSKKMEMVCVFSNSLKQSITFQQFSRKLQRVENVHPGGRYSPHNEEEIVMISSLLTSVGEYPPPSAQQRPSRVKLNHLYIHLISAVQREKMQQHKCSFIRPYFFKRMCTFIFQGIRFIFIKQ